MTDLERQTPRHYQCPTCGLAIHGTLDGIDHYRCVDCRSEFTVMLDAETGRAAFFAPPAPDTPHPLYLPQGSVRAMVSLGLAGACWGQVLLGRQVPGALLSLLLTVIGFYFGFRSRGGSGRDRIFDASVYAEPPLFLPAGVIRKVLLAGFAVSACVLYFRNQLSDRELMSFFLILFGLILGHLFGRAFGKVQGSGLYASIGHLKALVVLAAAALVILLILSDRWREARQIPLATLCLVISFYFGSRS